MVNVAVSTARYDEPVYFLLVRHGQGYKCKISYYYMLVELGKLPTR